MDPKLSGIDPKLQDAYNRVMNGPANPPSPQSQQPAVPGVPNQPVAPPPPPPNQPVSPPPPSLPPQLNLNPTPVQPIVSTDPSPSSGAPSFATPTGFNPNAGKNLGTVAVKRGHSKIMPMIVSLAVLVFLVGYTFVWIYFFKLKIPFLPQF